MVPLAKRDDPARHMDRGSPANGHDQERPVHATPREAFDLLRHGLRPVWIGGCGAERNGGIGPPWVFLVVNYEHPGQELDFVTEQIEGDCARQGTEIQEHASAEGNFVGHGARLGEEGGGGRGGEGAGEFGCEGSAGKALGVFEAGRFSGVKIILTLAMARPG